MNTTPWHEQKTLIAYHCNNNYNYNNIGDCGGLLIALIVVIVVALVVILVMGLVIILLVLRMQRTVK